MATAHGHAATQDPEYEFHRKTWTAFVRLVTLATIGVVLALIIMAIFLL